MKKIKLIIIFFCIVNSGNKLLSAPAFAIPTFHCLSVYWSPTGGNSGSEVYVQYREQGTSIWNDGLSMRYNPITGTTEDKADYRGSIVNLKPATTYEVLLSLQGTSLTDTITATTWSENFPEGTVVNVGSQTTTYNITQSGTPGAYRVYDGTGATIDVGHNQNYCINIAANVEYVIIRGFTLKGAGDTSSPGWPPVAAINFVDKANHVVIEDCDISDWGQPNTSPLLPNHGQNYDAGIYARYEVNNIVVQRNKIHDPTYTSCSWVLAHPEGPQTIAFYDSPGNNVIRYNELWSNNGNYYNDVLGYGGNGSYTGFPGADSDIYGNYIANCYDDGIEAEGGGQNVRIWNNFITECYMAIGNAAVSIGPFYAFRNVSGVSYSPPGSQYGTYASFLKMGYAGSESWMTGHMYVFHNTIYQIADNGFGGIGEGYRINKHCVSRNNILHVRSAEGYSISSNNASSTDNDYDYDLYNKTVPTGSQPNGINGSPTYVAGAGFNSSLLSGNFQLDAISLGYDDGTIINNFSDGYLGLGPDMGAHEAGKPNFKYGVDAVFPLTNDTLPPTANAGNDQTICPGDSIQLTASGGGNYLWNTGDTTSIITVAPTVLTSYNVIVSNTNGSDTDTVVVFVDTNLCATEVCNNTNSIVIDGVEEAAWTGITIDTLSKTIAGTISNGGDLSATYKLMWDNTGLYIIVFVNDDVKTNDSPNEWSDDGIELFLDVDNDKNSTYESDDRQYIIRWNDNTVYEHGYNTQQNPTGVTFAQTNTPTGYIVEGKIDWVSTGITPSTNQTIGFDIQVNDDDDGGTNLEARKSWEAISSPSGDASLMGEKTLGPNACNNTTNILSAKSKVLKIYPNPTNGKIWIEGNISNITLVEIFDLSGKKVKTINQGKTSNFIDISSLAKGTYMINIKQSNYNNFSKIIKK